MAPVNHNSLYQEAKASLRSLLTQTSTVFVGFILMLLLTGGSPSSFIVVLSVVLGMGFVTWSETKRLADSEEDGLEATSVTPEQIKLVKPFANAKNFIAKADLSYTNLSGVNLSNTDLSYADLQGADLNQANLSRANLKNAILVKATLINANLKDANVENAQFGDNKGISEELRSDLEARGAIFRDNLSDRSNP